MTITSADFFIRDVDEFADAWGTNIERVDRKRLAALISTPDPEVSDLDVAVALMDLVRDDLMRSGTSDSWKIGDEDLRLALRALQRVTARIGREFSPRSRITMGGGSGGSKHGAQGKYEARRVLLGSLFDEPYAALMAAQDRALDSALTTGVSPRSRLGWFDVDTEIGELRRHFRSANTPQDYRAIGIDCVHLTEALSRQVYDHRVHTPDGEEEPAVQRTKVRIGRYIDTRLAGSDNKELRKFAMSTIELAQAVKHSGTPTRTEAGVLADGVIMLANMLRRLQENGSG